MADIQHLILRTLDSAGDILDSVKFANERGIDHVKLTGQALSLESSEIIRKQVSFRLIAQNAGPLP